MGELGPSVEDSVRIECVRLGGGGGIFFPAFIPGGEGREFGLEESLVLI